MDKKILVVDDDRGIIEAFRAMLESVDYKVFTESDPANLNKTIEKVSPDLILLDVLLSGGDGRVICKELKSKPDTRGIPIIIVSAHPSAEESVAEAGADDFLEKPFEMTVLFEKIKRLIK